MGTYPYIFGGVVDSFIFRLYCHSNWNGTFDVMSIISIENLVNINRTDESIKIFLVDFSKTFTGQNYLSVVFTVHSQNDVVTSTGPLLFSTSLIRYRRHFFILSHFYFSILSPRF